MSNGLQWVNMKGTLKQIRASLAFDTELQRQMNFFPCNEDGTALPQSEIPQVVEKKSEDVIPAASDTIKDYEIPEHIELVNPLEEEKEIKKEPKKRGRKPKVTN